MSEQQVNPEDFNAPLPKGGGDLPPLEMLPDREWLQAKISDVKFQYSYFNNQPQYMTDKDDNQILDSNGLPIKRKEFKVTFSMKGYELSNGNPRNSWLTMGASMGEKAHLPKFLDNVGLINEDVSSAQMVIDKLINLNVQLQLKNVTKKDGSGQYQMVVWDAVKLDDSVEQNLTPGQVKEIWNE